MKKILKRTGKIFCLFLLIVVLVNILSPLFCRKPDETYVVSLRKTVQCSPSQCQSYEASTKVPLHYRQCSKSFLRLLSLM